MSIDKRLKRIARKKRIKSKVVGTLKRPRLSVFKSNKYIYAQVIDDTNAKTLISTSDKELKLGGKISKIDKAFKVGEETAKKLLKKKIESVVFDRSGYQYHGRVKKVAEGARKGGLKF